MYSYHYNLPPTANTVAVPIEASFYGSILCSSKISCLLQATGGVTVTLCWSWTGRQYACGDYLPTGYGSPICCLSCSVVHWIIRAIQTVHGSSCTSFPLPLEGLGTRLTVYRISSNKRPGVYLLTEFSDPALNRDRCLMFM